MLNSLRHLPYQELYEYKSCTKFLADFFNYVPWTWSDMIWGTYIDSDPEFQMVQNGGISLAMIWVGNLVPATIVSKGFSGASPAFQTTAMRQAQ